MNGIDILADSAVEEFRNIDGLEPIAFEARRTDSKNQLQTQRVSVIHALRRTIRNPAFQLQAASTDTITTTWHVLRQDLRVAGLEPRAGDVIIDRDDRTWTVLFIEEMAFGTRYRFTCNRGLN